MEREIKRDCFFYEKGAFGRDYCNRYGKNLKRNPCQVDCPYYVERIYKNLDKLNQMCLDDE